LDEFEERFILKHLHLKGWEKKRIRTELNSTFQGSVSSRATVKRWFQKFKSGDLSHGDESHPGRPLTILRPVLNKVLGKHPFASAKVISRPFDISPATVKEILRCELGLKNILEDGCHMCWQRIRKCAESIH
jgi:hypothetical protein